jgi:hypothetical protein
MSFSFVCAPCSSLVRKKAAADCVNSRNPFPEVMVDLVRILLLQLVVGLPAHPLRFGRELRHDGRAPAQPLSSLPDAPLPALDVMLGLRKVG